MNEFFGFPGEGPSTHAQWEACLHPEDVLKEREVIQQIFEQQREHFTSTYRILHPQKGLRWVQSQGRATYAEDGTPLRMMGVDTDVTERKASEDALSRLVEFRRSIMDLVEDGLGEGTQDSFYHHLLQKAVEVIPGAQAGSLLFRAADERYDFVAAVNYDLTQLQGVRLSKGYVAHGRHNTQPEVVTSFSINDDLPPDQRQTLITFGKTNELKAALSIPVMLDGAVVAHLSLDNFDSKEAFTDEAVEMARVFAGHVASLIRRFTLEQKLHRLAYQDALTELPNRALFKEHLQQALTQARRDGSGVAVLFVDLDNLKPINDSLGHRAGDEVLRVVAERLKRCTRTTETVARLSGDEFTLIVPSPKAAQDARRVAERILTSLAKPINTEGHDVHTSASIGISVYPADGETPEDLLKRADIAMYHAKQCGKNTLSFFTPGMDAAPLERLLLEEALRKALERNEFILHY